MKQIIFFIIVVFFIVSSLIRCSDQGTAPYLTDYNIPDKNVSFYKDLQPLFNGKCGFGSNCHSPENPDNLLFFTTKEVFISHVIPGLNSPLVDPEVHRRTPTQAPLYLIITEPNYAGFERQPPLSLNRAPLTDREIEGIRVWIAEGARD